MDNTIGGERKKSWIGNARKEKKADETEIKPGSHLLFSLLPVSFYSSSVFLMLLFSFYSLFW